MQEVSQDWKDMFNKRTLNESFVVIHIYDNDNVEIYKAEKEQIFSFTMTEEVSIIDETLPSNEITFSLDNHKGTFDIDNDAGLYNKLAYRNKVVVEIGYKLDSGEIEWISGGTYYLTEWTASSNSLTAEFTAKDILYFLTKNASFKYNENAKSLFSTYGDSGMDLNTIISRYLSLNGTATDFNSELGNITTTNSFSGLTNELLQETAQCGQMTLWVDREDTIHIDKVDLDADIEDYYIDDFNSFNYPEITLESPIDKIDIEYIVSSNSPNSYTEADDNTNIILGSGTGTTLTPFVCQSNTELGYMVSSNRANWLEGGTTPSSVSASKNSITIGFGSTTANPYTIYALTLQEITYTYNYALSSGDTTQTISNPLITSESVARDNAEWVGEYYSYRRVVECSYRADPRLDPLDIIEVYKKYGGTERVIVEYIKYEWSGGMFHGTMRGRSLGKTFISNGFENDSWELINEIAESGNAKKYYSVGDTKTITIDGTDYTFVILGFNHDDLSDGSGKAPITIGMENLYATTATMNSSSTNAGGWDQSQMRSETMQELYDLLPSDLQDVIKTVDKKASAGSRSSTITTSQDKLFLFSEVEINGTTSSVYVDEGEQYEYYKTIKDGSTSAGRIKYLPSGSAYTWWLRSPNTSYANYFRTVGSSGSIGDGNANGSVGVCFGFCI